jgi:hypothetical protein
MLWSLGGRCPYCGSGRFSRSRRISSRERFLGIVVLPYRCDRCNLRFFRLRWLSPQPYLERYRATRRRRRIAIAAAVVIVAVSLTAVLTWPELLKTLHGSADREAIPIQPADRPPPVSEIPVRPPASAPPAPARPAFRLRGHSGIAVVADDVKTATSLRASSATLTEAIRNGSVFSVPTGTPVAALERRDGLVQIRVLDGAMAGRSGWVSSAEMISRDEKKHAASDAVGTNR